MAATSIVSNEVAMSAFLENPLTKVLIKFYDELNTLYGKTKRIQIKSSWKPETKQIAQNNMKDIRTLTFKMNSKKEFKLILYKEGNALFIEIQTLLKHVTSWGFGKLHGYTANLKNVKEFIDGIPKEINTSRKINVLGLQSRSLEGYFIPISNLWFYVAKEYYQRLIKFITKNFVDGDYEGWMYLNLFKSKSLVIKRGKMGRTADIDQRNEKYKSEANKHSEICENWAIVKVKKVVFAENYLKQFLQNYDDVKNLKKGKSEYFTISNDPNEASQQLFSLANCWNDYLRSDIMKDLIIGNVEDSLINFTIASDELVEVIEGDDGIEDEYEYEEDGHEEEVVVIENDDGEEIIN